LADRKIEISLDKKATDWLANAGYDPVYGARPLKRAIQRRLQDPLAHLLLEGKITDGAKVTVSASKTGLVIDGQEFAASADELSEIMPASATLN
jgi:ATP-dependent Clp protease ATP-binding subunit ClpB